MLVAVADAVDHSDGVNDRHGHAVHKCHRPAIVWFGVDVRHSDELCLRVVLTLPIILGVKHGHWYGPPTNPTAGTANVVHHPSGADLDASTQWRCHNTLITDSVANGTSAWKMVDVVVVGVHPDVWRWRAVPQRALCVRGRCRRQAAVSGQLRGQPG